MLMRVVAVLGAILAISGCGSGETATAHIQRPSAPWPSSCVIDVRSDFAGCALELTISSTPDASAPIATVTRRDVANIRWSHLPDSRAKPIAHVDIESEGLHVEGWASLERERFELKSRVDIVPGNIWMPAGGRVFVQGIRGDRVVVTAPTGFSSPERVEGETNCSAFGRAPASSRSIVGPPFAAPTATYLALHNGPGGPVILEMHPSKDDLFVWLEDKAGSVHVHGGPHLWDAILSDDPFVFDGWVASSEVRRVEKLPQSGTDRDEGGCVLDTEDACPLTRFKKGSDLFVGREPKEKIGTIDGDAEIDLGEKHGDYVSVRTHNGGIKPPAGELFWARMSDVETKCTGDADNGCPCDTPASLEPGAGR
jgi:hypothetical protein